MVVQVTEDYLGQTSDRFISRQVENHLHKSPSQLSCADLEALIDWMSVAVSLMIESPDDVAAYKQKLRNIVKFNLNTQ